MAFDINDLRGVMSALILLTFIGLFIWVALGRRDRFAEAANLPFADDSDDLPGAALKKSQHPQTEPDA